MRPFLGQNVGVNEDQWPDRSPVLSPRARDFRGGVRKVLTFALLAGTPACEGGDTSGDATDTGTDGSEQLSVMPEAPRLDSEVFELDPETGSTEVTGEVSIIKEMGGVPKLELSRDGTNWEAIGSFLLVPTTDNQGQFSFSVSTATDYEIRAVNDLQSEVMTSPGVGFSVVDADGDTGTDEEDPCETTDCGLGTCNEVDGAGDCECDPDAVESNAEENFCVADPCGDEACSNHGTCDMDDNDEAACVCEDGFAGDACDVCDTASKLYEDDYPSCSPDVTPPNAPVITTNGGVGFGVNQDDFTLEGITNPDTKELWVKAVQESLPDIGKVIFDWTKIENYPAYDPDWIYNGNIPTMWEGREYCFRAEDTAGNRSGEDCIGVDRVPS